jgi:hypothetical protein
MWERTKAWKTTQHRPGDLPVRKLLWGERQYKEKGEFYMDIRNEIKSYIVREGVTMSEVVGRLAYEYGWSDSVPNLSGKLHRGSLRYREAVELADVLGYDIVWHKRGDR